MPSVQRHWHLLSRLRLTLTALPWKRSGLFAGTALLVSEYGTILGPNACIVMPLRAPPVQFYLEIRSPKIREISSVMLEAF
jgi:hypothetical protein